MIHPYCRCLQHWHYHPIVSNDFDLILNDMDKSADIKSEQVVIVGMFPGIYSIYCSLDATSSIAYHNVIEV